MGPFIAICPFCTFRGATEHPYKGQANHEFYRHLDTSGVCADLYEKKDK